MSHPSDYWVERKSERLLAADATALRVALRVDHRLEFDPLGAIRWFERVPLPKKGLLTVHRFDGAKGCPPARVKYDPLRLFATDGIMEAAEQYRDPVALYILTHELGHIIEHDRTAKAFSSDESQRLKAPPVEERAEWQADKFADHALLPWKFIIAYRFNVAEIAAVCNVESSLVIRQIDALRLSRRYVEGTCPECANPTLVRNGTFLKCETCGSATGCS